MISKSGDIERAHHIQMEYCRDGSELPSSSLRDCPVDWTARTNAPLGNH